MYTLWLNQSNEKDTRLSNPVNHNIFWLNLSSITMPFIRSKVRLGMEQKIATKQSYYIKAFLLNTNTFSGLILIPDPRVPFELGNEYLDEDKTLNGSE